MSNGASLEDGAGAENLLGCAIVPMRLVLYQCMSGWELCEWTVGQ